MALACWLRSLRSTRTTSPARVARPRRLSVEPLESRYTPSGGQLDTTFNGTGSVRLPVATLRIPHETIVQPDGKILSVGVAGATGSQAALIRMNADGSLDTTFHGTGQVLLPTTVAGVSVTGCQAVAVQPDGKIVVGLSASKSRDQYFAAARLNANGSVDTSFGTNAGYWLFNPQRGNPSTEEVDEVELLPDGSLIVGGGAKATDGYQGFAAVKVTAAGRTDTSYGTGGLKVVHVGTAANSTGPSVGMAVTPTGGVVLTGAATPAGSSALHGCIVALTPGGQLDSSFNGTGILFGDTPTGTFSLYYSVAMQGNNILVAGYSGTPGVTLSGQVARYTLSGALDTSFGVGGYFINAATAALTTQYFTDIKVAADGSIVAAGYAYYKDASNTAHYGYQIAHLSSDGAADTSFGSDGTGYVTVFDVGTVSLLGRSSLAIGPDGKILFAAVNGNPNYAVYFRYTAW